MGRAAGSKYHEKQNIEALLQFIKFGLVGLSNTLLSYGVELFCYYVLFCSSLRSEAVRVIAASLLAFLAGVTNSYFWNSRYVFNSGRKKTVRQHVVSYLRTLACYGVTGLALAPAIKLWLSRCGVPYWIAAVIPLTVTVPLNFLMNKFWAFRREVGKK